jgi:hypothetical protein
VRPFSADSAICFSVSARTNWFCRCRALVCGTLHDHRFDALVFPEHAENRAWEIGDSKISKLWIQRLAERLIGRGRAVLRVLGGHEQPYLIYNPLCYRSAKDNSRHAD